MGRRFHWKSQFAIAASAIWIDEHWLPWGFMRSTIFDVQSPFLEAGYPDGVPMEREWMKLEPGESRQGRIDLNRWLYALERPSSSERVFVKVKFRVYVDEKGTTGEKARSIDSADTNMTIIVRP